MSDLITPETVRNDIGKAKILATFKSSGSRQVVGGRVMEGKLKRGVKCEVWRGSDSLGEGKIIQLQQQKKDVSDVMAGLEFGVSIDSVKKIQTGDSLIAYEEEVVKKRL